MPQAKALEVFSAFSQANLKLLEILGPNGRNLMI